MKNKELYNFFLYISTLLNSNIELIDAIEIYLNKNQVKEVFKLKQELMQGKDLVKSFQNITRDKEILMFLDIANKTGNIKSSFNIIFKNLNRKKEIKEKIHKALTYPIILITISFIVILILFIFVIPKFKSIYLELELELPLITKIVVNIGEYILFEILVLILILIIFSYYIYYFRKNKRIYFDKKILKFKTYYFYKIYILTDLISNLLEANINFEKIMFIVIKNDNKYIENEIKIICKDLEKGREIYKSFDRKIFDDEFKSLVYIANKSSNLTDIFKRISNIYENKFLEKLDIYVKLIEPIILIVISLFIFIIFLSVTLPIIRLPNEII